MRFIRRTAIFLYVHFLLLSCCCAALPVNGDVRQQVARVQSVRPVHVGPLEPASTTDRGFTEYSVPHVQAGIASDANVNGNTGHVGSVSDTNIVHNPPPSIPIVHPAVDLSNGTAAVSNATTGTDSASNLLVPDACDAGGECTRLGEAIISSGEGPECRALLVTGKCSSKCLVSLKEAVEHKLWDACTKRCEDTDLVTGAASRLVELCQVRQPTLLDASKEALQIVAAAPGAGRVIQAFFILSVVFGIFMFCYRRKNTTLRMFFQKRLKRRSSERSIV